MIRTYNAEIASDFVVYQDRVTFLTGDVMLDRTDNTIYVKVADAFGFGPAFVPVESVTIVDLAVALA